MGNKTTTKEKKEDCKSTDRLVHHTHLYDPSPFKVMNGKNFGVHYFKCKGSMYVASGMYAWIKCPCISPVVCIHG